VISAQVHDEMLRCHKRLKDVLRKAQDQRPKHPYDWVENEHVALLVAVNEWAEDHDRPVLTLEDIERVEVQALGHYDYSSKFCLYIAEELYRP
jgi:hypothetical protein